MALNLSAAAWPVTGKATIGTTCTLVTVPDGPDFCLTVRFETNDGRLNWDVALADGDALPDTYLTIEADTLVSIRVPTRRRTLVLAAANAGTVMRYELNEVS